jgi:hypothetical protein
MKRLFVFTLCCGSEVFESRAEFHCWTQANAFSEDLLQAYAGHGATTVTVEQLSS